jgi:putative membrane protein
MATQRLLATLASSISLLMLQCGGEQKPAQSADAANTTTTATATTSTEGTAATPPTGTQPDTVATTATEQRKDTTADTTSANSNKPTDDAPPSALSDAQIAAITDGANGAEIEQAKLARTKSKNQKVLQFASMMITHHSEAQKKQAKLKITSAESPLSAQMTQDANQVLTSLKDKTGADFDSSYMRAQVDEHQTLLDTLNTRLLPSVSSPELKAYLQEIKTRVEQHLEAARTTESGLGNSPSTVNRPGNAASTIR